MISLSSEGKFSIIDSVVDKVSQGTITKSKQVASSNKSSEFLMISNGSTSQFEIIPEEIEEDDILEEIKQVE